MMKVMLVVFRLHIDLFLNKIEHFQMLFLILYIGNHRTSMTAANKPTSSAHGVYENTINFLTSANTVS